MPVTKVPAAFKTAPRLPPRTRSDDVCECGSAMHKTYVVAAGGDRGDGDGRRRTARSPVLWCRRCRNLGSTAPIKGQTEVRDARFKWACEHCGGAMHRLLLTSGDDVGMPIPLSYCMRCVSVSFRDLAGSDTTRTCDMCEAVVQARKRWCAGCHILAERWRKKNGVIPPSDDYMFAEVIRRVRAEAHRLGWSRRDGMRVCVSCRTEYAPNNPRKRRCGSCADARVRERQDRIKAERRERRERRRREAELRNGGGGGGGADGIADGAAPSMAAAVPADAADGIEEASQPAQPAEVVVNAA